MSDKKHRKEKKQEELEAEEIVNQDNTPKSDESPEEVDYKEKFNELNDKYLRLYSEYDNYRKRTANEKVELIKDKTLEMGGNDNLTLIVIEK